MPYQRGSGFVGLQQYLGANEEQAKKMGQGLAQQVNAEGQAAKGAIDAASQDFNTQAAAGAPTYQPAPYGLETGEDTAYYDTGAASAVYKGPTTLGNTEDLAKQANAASQTAGLASTDAGRSTLLAKGVQGNYGLGARSLDAYLAGRGGGAELAQATSKYAKLQDYLGTAKTQAEARGKQSVADATAVAGQYKAGRPQHGYAPSSGLTDEDYNRGIAKKRADRMIRGRT